MTVTCDRIRNLHKCRGPPSSNPSKRNYRGFHYPASNQKLLRLIAGSQKEM